MPTVNRTSVRGPRPTPRADDETGAALVGHGGLGPLLHTLGSVPVPRPGGWAKGRKMAPPHVLVPYVAVRRGSVEPASIPFSPINQFTPAPTANIRGFTEDSAALPM